jgi:hypothetical protein
LTLAFGIFWGDRRWRPEPDEALIVAVNHIAHRCTALLKAARSKPGAVFIPATACASVWCALGTALKHWLDRAAAPRWRLPAAQRQRIAQRTERERPARRHQIKPAEVLRQCADLTIALPAPPRGSTIKV